MPEDRFLLLSKLVDLVKSAIFKKDDTGLALNFLPRKSSFRDLELLKIKTLRIQIVSVVHNRHHLTSRYSYVAQGQETMVSIIRPDGGCRRTFYNLVQPPGVNLVANNELEI